MQVDCYIDGQLVDQIAHVADVGRDKSYGVTISQEQYRPYVFAEVLTTGTSHVVSKNTVHADRHTHLTQKTVGLPLLVFTTACSGPL